MMLKWQSESFGVGLYEILVPSQRVSMTAQRPCVEKQHIAPTGRQSIVLINGTDRKMYFSHLKELPSKKIFIHVSVPYIYNTF